MSNYFLSHEVVPGGGHFWKIREESHCGPIVFTFPFVDEDWEKDEPPLPVRVEYERLIK